MGRKLTKEELAEVGTAAVKVPASSLPVEQAPEEPSLGEAALKGVQDIGAFGFGDEAGAALQAGLHRLSGDEGSFSDRYRQAREENRAESEAARKAHPVAYYGAGSLAALPVMAATSPLRAAQGASLATRIAAGAGNAAFQGGLAGAGGSTAEDIGGVSKDILRGGAIGAGVGAMLPVAGAIGKATARKMAPWLHDVAISSGRRVLTNGADSLSTRLPVSEEAVQEALSSRAIRPFSTTEATSGRLQELAEQGGQKYADIIDKLQQLGAEGPRAKGLAAQLQLKAGRIAPNTMNEAVPALYESEAEKILARAGNNKYLGLKQAENLKRSLQELARYGRWEETPINAARRDIASMVREANEDAVADAGRMINDPAVRGLASEFVPVKQRLSRLLEAGEAAERGTSRGAQRGAFGLKDIAAGAAVGEPVSGSAAILGSKILRSRGPSTIAVAANRLAPAAEWLGQRSAEPAISATKPAILSAATQGERVAGLGPSFVRMLKENPEAFGRYAETLAREAQKNGIESAYALERSLAESDPEYRKRRPAP